MSHIIHELGAVYLRVGVLGVSAVDLGHLSTQLAEEAVISLKSMSSSAELVGARSAADGQVRSFFAFTLGARAGLSTRVQVTSMLISRDRPWDALEGLDCAIFDLRGVDPLLDSLITVQPPSHMQRLPIVILTPDGGDGLQLLATKRVMEEQFSRIRYLKNGRSILTSSLEWLLSF